jgi:TDG/mug DNA glycosylase family protein
MMKVIEMYKRRLSLIVENKWMPRLPTNSTDLEKSLYFDLLKSTYAYLTYKKNLSQKKSQTIIAKMYQTLFKNSIYLNKYQRVIAPASFKCLKQKNKNMALPDLLKENLKVVFVGTAVTKASKNAGAYYATHRNSFYYIINKIGLTETQINPKEYTKLLSYGIGLSDLVKNRTGLDDELVKTDFDIESFKKKIVKYNPKIVCFNGKLAAAYFFNGNKKTSLIKFGIQKQTINNTKFFVAPSTAATAKLYWDENIWMALGELIVNKKINISSLSNKPIL